MDRITAVEGITLYEFWTRLEELVEHLEECGQNVLEANDEYIVCTDKDEEDAEESILYLGHANKTIWVDRIE